MKMKKQNIPNKGGILMKRDRRAGDKYAEFLITANHNSTPSSHTYA